MTRFSRGQSSGPYPWSQSKPIAGGVLSDATIDS